VDVTSCNEGAYRPYDAQPCFMGYHILDRYILLEALVSVMLCDRLGWFDLHRADAQGHGSLAGVSVRL
jgi:hypothetical protein